MQYSALSSQLGWSFTLLSELPFGALEEETVVIAPHCATIFDQSAYGTMRFALAPRQRELSLRRNKHICWVLFFFAGRRVTCRLCRSHASPAVDLSISRATTAQRSLDKCWFGFDISAAVVLPHDTAHPSPKLKQCRVMRGGGRCCTSCRLYLTF